MSGVSITPDGVFTDRLVMGENDIVGLADDIDAEGGNLDKIAYADDIFAAIAAAQTELPQALVYAVAGLQERELRNFELLKPIADYFEENKSRILLNNLTTTLNVGYPSALDDLGVASNAPNGHVQLDFTKPAFKTLFIDADVSLDIPAGHNGICFVAMTNDGVGGHIPGWPDIKILSGTYDSAASAVNVIEVRKIGSVVTGIIQTVPA